MRASLGFFLLAAVMASGVSCRQIVGVGDQPPGAPAGNTCGLPCGTSLCGSCIQAHCCNQASACSSQQDCATYEGCLGKCAGDPDCRAKCTENDLGSMAPEVADLNACLVTSCENECALTSGALAGYITQHENAAACQACLSESSDTGIACGKSADCQAFMQCMLAYATGDWETTCGTMHKDGALLFSQFRTDTFGGRCQNQCAFGNYWACVGRVTWPPARATMVAETTQIVDFLNSTTVHLGGLSVQACGTCPCFAGPNLGGMGTTDANGFVSLSFRQSIDSSGHGLQGCLQVTSTPTSAVQILTTYAYWGFPLSQASGDATGPLMQIQAFTPDDAAQGLSLLGITQDTSRGYVGVVVADCLGLPASGVQIASDADAGASPIAMLYNNPGAAAQSTGPSGRVVMMNVPQGAVTLTARPLALKGGVSSSVQVDVRPGQVTEALMWPTPLQ